MATMTPPRVPRITRVWLTGFKSLEHCDLNLGRLNVLIGVNGSGKSNLLSFFRMLRSIARRNFQAFVGRSGGADMLLHYGAKCTPAMSVLINAETTSRVSEYDCPIEYAVPNRLLINDELYSEEPFDGSSRFNFANGNGPNEESELATDPTAGLEAGGETLQLFEQCRVYHFHDTTDRAPIRQDCEIDDSRALHEDGGNLAAVLYRIQKTDPRFFQQIERTVKQAAPFFHSFSLAPSALNKNQIALRWREIGHDEDFNCHYLSDGTLRFIALTTLLLQPESDLPGVIIIDEPELGLHPHAVTLLATMIHRVAEHRQVIVATQSPSLLDQFDPQDVIVVERRNRATEFKRFDDPAELAEWLEEYSLGELWDKNVLGGRPVPWAG